MMKAKKEREILARFMNFIKPLTPVYIEGEKIVCYKG